MRFSGSKQLGGVELLKMCQTHSGPAAMGKAKSEKNEAFRPRKAVG